MRKAIKIVTIGGGSSYTPELMEGFIRRYEAMPIREIWLVDTEGGQEKLEVVGEMARRMWAITPYPVKVHLTLDRREALKDADFVTTQLRVGQLDARIKDERIPLLHGVLGQETNGAGGIMKAFRTIPVIREIVEDMKELCPDAWLINFTNPSGMVTEAVIRHFGWEKCIGLCNVPEIAMMKEPAVIGLKREDLTYRFAGLNHFHWHRVWDREGRERTAELIEHMNDRDNGTPANIHQADFPLDMLRKMQLLPCGYHRYYYMAEEMLAHSLEAFKSGGTRAEQMHEVEASLLKLYRDPHLDHKPEQLEKRGGAYYSNAACECIQAIQNDTGQHMVVSTRNNGAISCLDPSAIVEISCVLSAKGAEPIAWGPMRPAERGWLQVMKAMEECVIEAALTGDYGLALEAFTLNPLIPSGAKARRILDELLVAHEKDLPQFSQTISQLKAQGVASNDPVVMALMRQ